MAYEVSDETDLQVSILEYTLSKTPLEIEVARICTPLPTCTTAALGAVDPQLVDTLRDRRYDQAPIRMPQTAVGWGIVTRATLEARLAAGAPLESHDVLSTAEILWDTPHPLVPIDSLFGALKSSSAIMALTTFVKLQPTNSEVALPPSEHDGVIYGLITVSDLNHREVRRAAYELIVELEGRLAEMIRFDCTDPWEWIDRLTNEDEKARIVGYWELLRRRGIDSDPISLASLTQLITIAGKSPWIRDRLGHKSRGTFEGSLPGLSEFRNRVMHPTRPLVSHPMEVEKYHELTRALRAMADRLDDTRSQRQWGRRTS